MVIYYSWRKSKKKGVDSYPYSFPVQVKLRDFRFLEWAKKEKAARFYLLIMSENIIFVYCFSFPCQMHEKV